VAHAFLDANGLRYLIRSHEVKDDGFDVEADGRVITIFSAPNYCDSLGNKGAFININGEDMLPQCVQFDPVPHPNVPPMLYADPLMFQ
jgi:serine/threonine-protein phosphatase 5